MSALQRITGAAVAAALVVGLGFLSRAPVAGEHAGEAALRLTWRLRAEEVGECRRPSAEELAQLPVHMRNPDACVGAIPPYELVAEVDGAERIRTTIEAAGARGDRPLYVYRQLLLEPGSHQVHVRFSRDGSDGDDGTLTFRGEVTLEAGQVLLLTRTEAGELEVREPAGP